MPYVSFKEPGLFSITDAARECGLTVGKFWDLVTRKGVVPEPKTKRGRRYYYTEFQMEKVREAVGKLTAN